MPDILELIASVLQMNAADLKEDDGNETIATWDSLKILMIASMIEISYDLTLDNSDIEQLTTVRAARAVLSRHGRG